ncbi:LuxR family transcriptional regulator [Microbacterium sp.]|uniref:LuxR family transcriptional regulator n=1 Tax=Microbacterium sp. TaxID=51671 RepID=UPI0027348A6D|nr:LuxR family transcriptional regulator [Microbacterium sp.]MDP3949081.1 LuxR C-terminal-related transcriptional regulator [Microbacterium sp.]
MRDTRNAIEAGRRAYADADWGAAFEQLASVRTELTADDLALLARCAWYLSRIPESIELSEESYRRYTDDGRPEDAARTALLLTLLWFTRGELSMLSGWLNRSRRLLSELSESTLHGYLAYLEGMHALFVTGASPDDSIRRLRALSGAHRDPALEALELAVSGAADLRRGETARGFARLDEAMLPVIAGHLPPEWGGDLYCTVIHVCHQLADFRRMADWTSVTERWCEKFASQAIYSGICRVHRLELRGAHGDWTNVEAELALESSALVDNQDWVAGEGFYQLGEIRRGRGDAVGARGAYAAARDLGIDPQPGDALLLLAEGRADAAWTALAASLASRDRLDRVRLLRAGVEIALAVNRHTKAEEFCRELRAAADDYRSPGFATWALHAEGMLALAQGQTDAALTSLRSAANAFRRDRQPYEVACVLQSMAQAHRASGESAQEARDRAEAGEILSRLGAVGEVAPRAHSDAGPLTTREAEVLDCAAEGGSNRDIAARLFISEKTVGRHLANIYLKLGVGSRTAAAAWWRERGRAAS